MGKRKEKEDEATDRILYYVWSGFYTPDEVLARVRDGGIGVRRVRAMIAQAFAQKAAEEATWPAVTDCDRIDAVFAALLDQGIIALQNAGYTMSDGHSDISSVYHETAGAASVFDGYCFYHGQDLESAVAGGGLMLAFGDIDGDDAKGIEVGRRIQKAFEAAGFAVDWNGSIKNRIYVGPIRWQRRSPRSA